MVLRLPLISHSVGILGNFVLGFLLTFGNRSTFVTMEQEMCDHRGCDDSVSTNCKLQQETEQGLEISNGVAGDDNNEAVRVMPLGGKPTVNRGDEESEVSNNGVPSVGEGDEESEVGNSGVVFKKQSNVVEAPKMEVVEGLEKQSCVIDVKVVERLAEKKDQEKVCRICHLSAEQSDEDAMSTELILLGCNCKDELGIAHVHCAESWFKLKGNRLCEICGQTAKNITGIRDNRFLEQWEVRRVDDINASGEGERCWRGQPFCNFLMACLVFAFVLPWFFRVNMF